MKCKKYKLWLCICLSFHSCLVSLYSAQLDDIRNRLYQDVFHKSNYTHELLPICQDGDKVTVKLQLALRQILDVDEIEHIVTANAWLRVNWYDCRLKWNASNYNGIKSFFVPYFSVWMPDITLYDSATDDVLMQGKELFSAFVQHNGSVRYAFPTVLKSLCRIDVKYFPFDTQRCTLTLGSWSHNGYEVDVTSWASKGDLTAYIKNNEWEITEFPIKGHIVYYECCPEPYPDVTFYLTLKRKSRFYVLTVIFPCILTGSVGATSFILPPDSGEKVSLSITVLLSYVVFMLMISEQLPASSDTFPYIALGTYIASSMTLVALSCFMTVVVLNIHYRGNNGRKVSRWIRVIIINILGRLVCSRKNTHRFYMTLKNVGQSVAKVTPETKKAEEKDIGNGHIPNSKLEENYYNEDHQNRTTHCRIVLPNKRPTSDIFQTQSVVLDKIEKNTEKENESTENNVEWHEAAFIMDRVFLLIYVFTATLTVIIFLANMTCE